MITLIVIAFISIQSHAQTTTMPNTCSDLLPEMGTYIEFMEQVGVMWISASPKKAQKIYDALAVRTLYQETTRDYINPIDKMIKDFLCKCYFDNEQKPFSADSAVIRKYSNKNIDSFIRSATDEYVNLKLHIHEEERTGRVNKRMAKRAEGMKTSSLRSVEKRANELFRRKLKKTK